nr:hypothetical protein BaRGS_008050 [Batillaria attramentaria]
MAEGVTTPGMGAARTTGFPVNGSSEPMTTAAPDDGDLQCDYINTSYSIVAAILSVMCFMFGVLYTFFGYRFFKAVMFLTGFIFASVLVYTICIEEDALPPEGNIGVTVGAGILCGLVTMLVQYVGIFLTGFHFGVALAVGALIIVEQFVHPGTKWIPIGVLVGVGIIFAVVSLKFQKAMTILGTSILGGALMVTCLDYFIEQAAMMQYVWDRMKGDKSQAMCWYSWVILGCWPFCCLVGALVQWRITGMGVDHREGWTRKTDSKKDDKAVLNRGMSMVKSFSQMTEAERKELIQKAMEAKHKVKGGARGHKENRWKKKTRNSTPAGREKK